MNAQSIFLAIGLIAASTAGSAQVAQPAMVPETIAAATIIGPGDLLGIKVFSTPDLDREFRVNSSGVAIAPLIGEIHLAGLDTQQAGQEIAKGLMKAGYFTTQPDVSVVIVESVMQRVSILGEVKNPGSIPLLGQQRLLDVISAAGGLLPSASGMVTITHQEQPDKVQSARVYGGLSTSDNPEVNRGDTIFVEKAGIVYVVGSVNKPGGFMLESGKTVSLLQAMALAEGNMPTAKLKDAHLIRMVNDERQDIRVNLKAVLRNRAVDLKMQGDDILFIPDSELKRIMRDGISGAIELAAGVSVYRF
jgi:polysaccharide export outer membrane protein